MLVDEFADVPDWVMEGSTPDVVVGVFEGALSIGDDEAERDMAAFSSKLASLRSQHQRQALILDETPRFKAALMLHERVSPQWMMEVLGLLGRQERTRLAYRECPSMIKVIEALETQPPEGRWTLLQEKIGPSWVACDCKTDLEWLLAMKTWEPPGAKPIGYGSVSLEKIRSWFEEDDGKQWAIVVTKLNEPAKGP